MKPTSPSTISVHVMAYSVHITAEARADQESIVGYLMNDLGNQKAAKHFIDELEKAISALEETPNAFPFSQEPRLRFLGYQKALLMNYILLFRTEKQSVYIIRIFHQSQDYAKLV